MRQSGPVLETLLHRLADTPPEFLDEPRVGNGGRVVVAALVNDVLLLHGARAPRQALLTFHGGNAKLDRNRLALVMICAWLLADESLLRTGLPQAVLLAVFGETAAQLAAATPAHQFVHDPERREELARMALARLDLRPDGETLAQATDRLSAISGTERKRLLEASRVAEQRASDIRAALARKAAAESADKWSRE